ncbi:GNAT family N-acetyltransferase [Stappia indica]|uniref:GNAT family N-acetyltransferase n=1 Tax=Stappia indica TaxID=538381 RepID=UPI001CD20309|nr:GNAT family N-acetyltransferase [Stappia indica]MCA1297200.1 GNAT family N-acetyltransferase [Stappia indica]
MRIDAMLESGDFAIRAANDPAEVEVEWRALQENAFGTLFTSYDWLSSWQHHVGRARGIEALIVVGTIEGKPAFLLPLGLMRAAGGTLTIARFLADFHGNQNSGLWRRDILAGIHGRTLRKALISIGRRHGIDLFDLKYVPAEINGRVHPLVDQASIESLNAIHALPLIPDFDTLYKARRSSSARKKLRTKEKKLGEIGPVRIERARDAATALSFLDTLIAQRGARQESSGIPNVFEPEDVRAFLSEQLTKALDDGSDSFMIHALIVGDAVKATYLSGLQFDRFHAYTNSISEDVAACSPGDILLNHVVAEACALGAATFDFGLGAERYKTAWADKEVLMDIEIPVTFKGRCAEMSVRALRNSKRYIRNSPRLWAIVRRLRRLGLPL